MLRRLKMPSKDRFGTMTCSDVKNVLVQLKNLIGRRYKNINPA
jgi:hypothetical protein